jgi:cell wall-associated NlpC family hydrolase
MTAFDRRLTPARPDLAAAFLQGRVEAARFVEGRPMRVGPAVAALRARPDAAAGIDTELLPGEPVTVYDEAGGFAYLQSDLDAYVGYADRAALEPPGMPATHAVSALRTFVYPGPSIKLAGARALPFGARVTVVGTSGDFALADTGGHIIAAHLAPLASRAADPAGIAELFLHTPYLWGGRSSLGLDCSGLLQTALRAAGHAAPRDSDMLESWCGARGKPVTDMAALRRGDAVFWQGHCGLMLDNERLIHANGYHMAVAIEPLAVAEERIRTRSYGPITAMVRLPAA